MQVSTTRPSHSFTSRQISVLVIHISRLLLLLLLVRQSGIIAAPNDSQRKMVFGSLFRPPMPCDRNHKFNAYSLISFVVCRQVGDAGVTCLCPKGFKGKKCQIPEDETMIGEYNYSRTFGASICADT